MELKPFEQAKQNGSGPAGPVWPEAVDVAGLSLRELRERLGLIKTAEGRLAAMKAATLAAYSSRAGEGQARQTVFEEFQASKQQARREVQSAAQMAEVPQTLQALAAGEIPEAHAKKIAKAVSEGPVNETVLVEAARTEDFGTFTRTVRDQQHQASGDDGTTLLADKRKRRTLNYFTAPDDGMFVLSGRFDPVAGNRIEAALAAEIKRQRNSDNEDSAGVDKIPFDQRLADAFEILVCADPQDRKPQGTTLILTADWDTLNQHLSDARLTNGDPLPVTEALRLACDADILPTVFNTKGQKLWVGHKHRSATEAQRAALIKRDRHCIGCGRTAVWCEAHHITEWHKGGTTDLDNLVLVCTTCHHNIHDQNWTVHRRPDGTYELRPPPPSPTKDACGPNGRGAGGWLRGQDPAPPRAGPPRRQDPPAHRGDDPKAKPKEKPNPDGLTLDSEPFPDTGVGRGVPAGIPPLLLC